MQVLIVDDDESSRFIVRRQLSAYGREAVERDDRLDALAG